MALTIDQILDGLTISRSEFELVFLQAQIDTQPNSADRTLLEAVANSAADRDAFRAALIWADQKGFLDSLVRIAISEGRESGKLTEALAAEAADRSADPARKAELQAITDMSKGFDRPEMLFRGMNMGSRWTVRILVNGAFSGSGILVGPHLVLTAWHVIKDLFDPNGPARFRPKPNSHHALAVEFDDMSGLLDSTPLAGDGTHQSRTVRAHVQWYATHSECHPDELKGILPDNPEGFWDYAVVRLAETPGLERRWAPLDARAAVPSAAGRIMVFQYPAGHPIRVKDGAIIAPPQPGPNAFIPRCRFLHDVNTLGGSSGGPCFDRAFMLFGLHQGEWIRKNGEPVLNRGIPIQRIKDHIQESIRELPVPDPSETRIWRLPESEEPVIGTDSFQSLVWRSAVTGKPRLILIPNDRNQGKTFRLSILSAMLPAGGHLKVNLSAEAVSKLNAEALATEICKKAGTRVPTFVAAPDGDGSANTWVTAELLEKTIRALEEVRDQRLVWICIAELNKHDIQGLHSSAFLTSLYERTKTVEWLRVVLDGMKGDTPDSVRKLTESQRVTEAAKDEIETYIRRVIAEHDTPLDSVVKSLANGAYKTYEKGLTANPATAMTVLVEITLNLVEQFLD